MTASLTFVGTATTVLRLGAFTVLTDPNFLRKGQWAYLGWGLATRRRTEPALRVDEVPALDAVLLSHLHGDHFDRVARRGLPRTAPVLTTPPAARRLQRYGFSTCGLPTWEQHELCKDGETLRVESLPGIHARGVLGAMLPPVMGALVTHEAPGREPLRLYVSGDTLTGGHLDEIAERHPRIDAAVVHLGGTRVLTRTVTMDGEQGVDLLQRLRPRRAVPVHFDDYGVFRSPLSDFLDRVGQAPGTQVTAVDRGDTVTLVP